MELFENTLYINLEHRRDRLMHVTSELANLGIEGERVNAVKTKVGAIGCTMSHIKCLEIAKERGWEKVFICEDDITFLSPEGLEANLEKFMNEQKDLEWDVLIIGGNNVPPYDQITGYLARVYSCQTTTGYIVRRHYYDTLLQNFRESAANLIREPTKGSQFALDIYWKRLQKQDKWFMIIPPTVTQYESYSDIEGRNVNYDHLMLDMEKTWLRR
jgi:GR25 family glycosyltransferase involved in LPS biosynthesis